MEDVAAEVAAVLARKREAMETAAAAAEEAVAAEAAPAPAEVGAGEEAEGAALPAPEEEGEGAAAEGEGEGAAAGEEAAAADADADAGAGAAAPAAEAGSVHRSMASLALERWGACEDVFERGARAALARLRADQAALVGHLRDTSAVRPARPPPPSRTKWTRLVHPSVLIGHASSIPAASPAPDPRPGRHVLGFCHEACALGVVKPAPCPLTHPWLLLLAAVPLTPPSPRPHVLIGHAPSHPPY